MTSAYRPTACPHDCPSACALEVEVLDDRHIGKVRGAKENSYTRGVICSKVSRYAERVHHPDRLMRPLRRMGARGDGRFEPISWEEALGEVAYNFQGVSEFGKLVAVAAMLLGRLEIFTFLVLLSPGFWRD